MKLQLTRLSNGVVRTCECYACDGYGVDPNFDIIDVEAQMDDPDFVYPDTKCPDCAGTGIMVEIIKEDLYVNQ